VTYASTAIITIIVLLRKNYFDNYTCFCFCKQRVGFFTCRVVSFSWTSLLLTASYRYVVCHWYMYTNFASFVCGTISYDVVCIHAFIFINTFWVFLWFDLLLLTLVIFLLFCFCFCCSCTSSFFLFAFAFHCFVASAVHITIGLDLVQLLCAGSDDGLLKPKRVCLICM